MLRGRLTAEMCCESLGVYTCCLHPSIRHFSVLMARLMDLIMLLFLQYDDDQFVYRVSG